MPLFEQLNTDLKQAMREKNTQKLSTLRMILTDIKNVRIDKQRELTDEDIIEILSRQVKQREDASQQYKQAQRLDLAEKEEAEKVIIQSYLPDPLSDDEIKQMIQIAIEEKNTKDFKTLVGLIMPQTKGRADGKKVIDFIKELTS